MKLNIRLLSIVALLGLLTPFTVSAAGLPVTYSASVLPQNINVPAVQGDIILKRVGGQNDVEQDILFRGVADGVIGFDETGALKVLTTLAVAENPAVTGNLTVAGTTGLTGLATLTGGAATGAKIYPSTDDGAALGDATHNFSDLFLASGAVLNYANGNVAITHTSGILTMGTGDFRVTTAGTNSASVVTVGGTQTLTNKTLTAPVIGVATGTSLAVTAGLTSSGATGAGIGYATGAGGAVTQLTDATTAVELNKLSGAITTVSLTLAAGVDTNFTLTNSTIAATDVVVASIKSYGGTADGIPVVSVVATAAGSCVLNVRNTGAVSLDALAVINFAVIKAVAN